MTSQYVDVDGYKIHYLTAGEGRPILLIHGFPTSSHLWRNVIPEIATSNRVLAIDLPGYGRSDKPLDVRYDFLFFERIVDGFLDAVGIEKTALAVHDLGGPVGLFWAVRQPRRVTHLVILNTLVYPETSWAVKLFLIAMRLPILRNYLVSQRGLVASMKLGVVHKRRLDRATLTPYTAPFTDDAARKALIKAGSELSVKGLSEIAAKLPTIDVPVRVIYGENDRILPDMAKTAARLQNDLLHCRVTALPDCGHFLQEDEPQRVGQLISEFLEAQA
jgi:haloalkane dehalogenase